MIYTLYGSDTYRSRKKLNEIIEAYRQKAGADIDFHCFDAREQDLGELKQMMNTSSLFTPKKLVVVDYAFGGQMEPMVAYASKWRDAKDQHLILRHEAIDANAKKYLKIWEPFITQSQEFEELKGAQKETWITKEAHERGVSLASDDARHIASTTLDSWSVVQEIEKIAVGGKVERIGVSGKDPTVFDLGDVFFTDKKKALGILHDMFANGEDAFGLFSYLSNRARALVAIKQCAQQNKQVPPWLGIHPFVAKKTAAFVRALTPAQCAAFVFRFFEEDFRIKVGLSQPADSLMRMLME